ncbi:DNA alkylation repair protein [Paenibacillus sp. NPDC058071]|uniref:DNA alkylation repair protein n=1 Tax=Paenibacillus sp. NPDC058071 TaxID=3346326 RepID=UPI0036D955E2
MTKEAEWLEERFREQADAEQASAMEAYMRNLFPFLGIRGPERTALARSIWKELGVPKGEQLVETALALWRLPEREFQYTAIELLDKHAKKAERGHVDVLELLVTDKSWWDTVDLIASRLVGTYFVRYPDAVDAYTSRWIESDSMWLRRTALLYQLKYKEKTDTAKLFAYIDRCKEENEFFIRKAIGWALREYAKTDENAVRRFVEDTALSPLSRKEALKHLK